MILLADLELTRRCNLQCAACFVKAQPNAEAELPTELALDVLDQLAGRRSVVHLTGGEPFLHPGIWTILERARELRQSELVINTNATLLDGPALARLAALGLRTTLLVSLDGPPGTHTRSRGADATQAALRVIRALPSRDLIAQPATILTRELLDYGVSRWHRWLQEQTGRRPALVLFPLFVQPGVILPDDAVGTPLEPADLPRAARQVVASLTEDRQTAVIDFPLINPLLHALGVHPKRLHQCMAGRGRFCVQADGTVTPCHPLQYKLFRAGPDIPGRLARHAGYRRLGMRRNPSCRGCRHLCICGHCRAVVRARGATLWGDDGWCSALGLHTSVEPPPVRDRPPPPPGTQTTF